MRKFPGKGEEVVSLTEKSRKGGAIQVNQKKHQRRRGSGSVNHCFSFDVFDVRITLKSAFSCSCPLEYSSQDSCETCLTFGVRHHAPRVSLGETQPFTVVLSLVDSSFRGEQTRRRMQENEASSGTERPTRESASLSLTVPSSPFPTRDSTRMHEQTCQVLE